MMENFTLLSVVIFIMFLITAGMIIVRKIEFVRALPAFGIITALLAGVPITGNGENIANFVIVQGVINLAEPMFIYVLSMMFAKFIIEYKIKNELYYLCEFYLMDKPVYLVWCIAIVTVIISTVIMNIGAIMLSAILFISLLLKIGFNKQTALSLLLLATGLGSCLNSGYHLLYANLLNLNLESVKDFYYIMAGLCFIALMVYISINSNMIKLQNWKKPAKQKVNFKLLCMVIMPVVFIYILKINVECSLILTLSYGYLVIGSKKPFIGLLFFTILTPLVLYKGPFNLQGMGAGLSTVVMASTTMNPMVLGMALLSLNTLRKIMDPIDVQNIAVMQYIQVDNNKVIKKVLPYAMAINYFALFYALVAVST